MKAFGAVSTEQTNQMNSSAVHVWVWMCFFFFHMGSGCLSLKLSNAAFDCYKL